MRRGLTAAILDFRLPVTRGGIYSVTFGMADLENLDTAVETALISSLQAEISVLPV